MVPALALGVGLGGPLARPRLLAPPGLAPRAGVLIWRGLAVCLLGRGCQFGLSAGLGRLGRKALAGWACAGWIWVDSSLRPWPSPPSTGAASWASSRAGLRRRWRLAWRAARPWGLVRRAGRRQSPHWPRPLQPLQRLGPQSCRPASWGPMPSISHWGFRDLRPRRKNPAWRWRRAWGHRRHQRATAAREACAKPRQHDLAPALALSDDPAAWTRCSIRSQQCSSLGLLSGATRAGLAAADWRGALPVQPGPRWA